TKTASLRSGAIGLDRIADRLAVEWVIGFTGIRTQADCDWVATKLNSRPRKRLGYKTPEECYAATR
ncbi:MAG: hypothetical protein CVT60_04955, partial [Actinobacteria bacterium HGW-Actinobacteria-10]